MTERQEKAWVVLRKLRGWQTCPVPVKVFDDRADARAYANRMDKRSLIARYSVAGVKRG